MPLFIRKSLRAGPFRFNLSKSGIGVSAGVPGLRVGLVGPRGHYVYAGRGGLYYRKSLNRRTDSPSSQSPGPILPDASEPVLENVTGATVMQMAESSKTDFVHQLADSAKAPSVWGWAAFAGVAATVIGLFVWWPISVLLLLATLAGTWWLRQRDVARHTVVVFYDVNDQYAKAFEGLVTAFGWLSGSQRRTRLTARGATSGYQSKVNAGASEIDRVSTVTATLNGPPHLSTNVSVPSLEDAQHGLYLLPDRVLIRDGQDFAEASYDELTVTPSQKRWIEGESVPPDAKQIDTAWQYMNKSGGPDRRFRNNRQLPVLLLSSLRLTTTSGLDSSYLFSNPDSAANFAASVAGMKGLAAQPGAGPPVLSPATPQPPQQEGPLSSPPLAT